MDFNWSDSEGEVKNKVAGLLDEAAFKEISVTEEADLPALKDFTLGYLGRLADTGYLGIGVGPKARDEVTGLVSAQEELAKASSSLYLSVETTARLFGGLIAGWGTDAMVSEIFEPLKKGGVIGAVALSEPGGSEPSLGWKTTAVAEGDAYILNGSKSFVTNGPIADWIAVAGGVDDKMAFFLVKTDKAGVTVGSRIKTMGYDGLAVSGMELKDVEVKASHVIGPIANGEAVQFLDQMQDLVLVGSSLGVMSRVFGTANEHARTYHRGAKPTMAYQEVRFRFSDMFTLYQTSQLLAYRAAWFFAEGDGEAPVLINCAKVFTAEAAEKIAGLAMQVMAGHGYVAGNPVERGYRDAKFAGIAGTTSEVSRMKIADALLKRFAI